MNTRHAILVGILAAGLLSPHAGAQPSGSERALRFFFENPSDEDLRFAANAIRRAQDLESIRGLLRYQFREQWITGVRTTGPTLQQFDALAQLCAPFGPANAMLVDLLAGPAPPAGWRRADFREHIRARLPARADGRATVERLLGRLPELPRDMIARLAFLTDVLPEENSAEVHNSLLRRISMAMSDQMPEYHNASLALPAGFTRFRAGDEAKTIRRALGDRLFTLSPATWSKVGDALPALIAAAGTPAAGFLQKAADHLRRQPSDRGPAAGMLALLTDLMDDPMAAFQLLDPAHDSSWFAWLHTAPGAD